MNRRIAIALIDRARRGMLSWGSSVSMVASLWLGGCIGEFFVDPSEDDDPPPQGVAVDESFVQAPLPKVDLLFVIDDTGSMDDQQEALGARLPEVLGDLDELGVGWQIGVTSTDMLRSDAGWLRGSPYVLTPDTPDREAAFAATVQVGTHGRDPEAGLAAAARALLLSRDAGPNAGFRRPDAVLHVVFVSDSDDQSADWLGAAPAESFLELLADEAAETGLPARASAMVGPVPDGCGSTAQPAFDYAAVAEGSGGVVVSICAPDLQPVLASLADVAVVWPTTFVLRNVPIAGSVRVWVDDEPVDGFQVDAEKPAVVLDEAPRPESRIHVSYLVRLTP